MRKQSLLRQWRKRKRPWSSGWVKQWARAWMPTLRCCWDAVRTCGGSVRLAMNGWLRPYQRIGEDIDAQVRCWRALRLSLREMQAELAQLHLPPLALRTLNQRLQQVAALPAVTTAAATTATAVAPVLQVDAIWVTQLVPTGTYHRDAKGRRRPDKKRIKRPILIALGVWPDSDRAEVLAWHLADREDEGAWLAFLSDLEAAGICGANGLELIIHDGGRPLRRLPPHPLRRRRTTLPLPQTAQPLPRHPR